MKVCRKILAFYNSLITLPYPAAALKSEAADGEQAVKEWQENALYRSDALVRKSGVVYKASGYPQGVAALPGSADQQKLYQVLQIDYKFQYKI